MDVSDVNLFTVSPSNIYWRIFFDFFLLLFSYFDFKVKGDGNYN